MYSTESDIQFARARSDVKVSVVAGSTYDGESGDSNLGCIVLVELFREALDSFPLARCALRFLQCPLYSSYIQIIGSCGFVVEPSIYLSTP